MAPLSVSTKESKNICPTFYHSHFSFCYRCSLLPWKPLRWPWAAGQELLHQGEEIVEEGEEINWYVQMWRQEKESSETLFGEGREDKEGRWAGGVGCNFPVGLLPATDMTSTSILETKWPERDKVARKTQSGQSLQTLQLYKEGLLAPRQITVRLGCHRQYCIPLKQEQRKAYKPSFHWGRVHPESASSPVITGQWHQECLSEPITNFSDWAHIRWSLS